MATIPQPQPPLPPRPPPPTSLEQFMNLTATAQPPPAFQWHYGDPPVNTHHRQANGLGVLLLALLSLALFLTLVYLYARWTRCYRHDNQAVTISVGDPLFPPGRAAPSGLNKRFIEDLPVRLHKAAEGAEAEAEAEVVECAICLSKLVVGEKVKVLLGCEHAFHPGCVEEWLKAQPTCPLCRKCLAGVSVKEKVVEVDPLEVV